MHLQVPFIRHLTQLARNGLLDADGLYSILGIVQKHDTAKDLVSQFHFGNKVRERGSTTVRSYEVAKLATGDD